PPFSSAPTPARPSTSWSTASRVTRISVRPRSRDFDEAVAALAVPLELGHRLEDGPGAGRVGGGGVEVGAEGELPGRQGRPVVALAEGAAHDLGRAVVGVEGDDEGAGIAVVA